MDPRSFFRFSRHNRALLRFLSNRYSSDGKNLRIEINEALLTISTLKRKSPTFTISGFFASFLPRFLGVSGVSGTYVTPSGKFLRKSAVMRAFCTLFLFFFLSADVLVLALGLLLYLRCYAFDKVDFCGVGGAFFFDYYY